MKNFLAVSMVVALGFTSVVFADCLSDDRISADCLPDEPAVTPVASSDTRTGIYTGLAGGFGVTNYRNNIASPAIVQNDTGVTGRAVVGYDVSSYFAVEAGYSYFFNKVNLHKREKKIRTQAVDAYFKGKLPIIEELDLFAKLGAGWLFKNFTPKRHKIANSSTNNINVAFGFGADFHLTSNTTATIEWMRIAGCPLPNIGKTTRNIPNTDQFMVGLRYRF